jgi:hypothetical protein
MNKQQALKAIEQIDLSTLSDYALEEVIKSYCVNREYKGCDGCPLISVNHCREIE